MADSENENTTEKRAKKPRHRKKQLFKSILQQMEFYFSDSNLSKDRFLSQLISEDPYVDVEVFLKFNKIRKLDCTIEDIRKAIGKSELIELSEDSEKVRRKNPLKVKQNVDECTIYVENIPADADHDWIKQKFVDLGNVVYVSIPKYKHNRMNKGFAFVEFETENEAKVAVDFFESIDCKMSLEKDPEQLKSIATFEGNKDDVFAEKEQKKSGKKRKIEMENDEGNKKSKKEECSDNEQKAEVENKKKRKLSTEDTNAKKKVRIEETSNDEKEKEGENKKKNKKKDKKKNQMKELGLQVLSKKEWKKIRNRYLDLQKKKMKEFKQYLHKQKYNKQSYDDKNQNPTEDEEPKEQNEAEASCKKIEFTPGVIVKVNLPEPCSDVKKMKNDLKSVNPNVKYIDVPLPAGSEEIFVRFGDGPSAKEFCDQDFPGEKILLEGDEEKEYWEKIENDRNVKFSKASKKQRGRDRLLKKAEKEKVNHIRFEESETLG